MCRCSKHGLWSFVARDAGNGLPLWRAKIKTGKEFDWEYSVKVAALIASRGERVYALAEDGRLYLSTATGRVICLAADGDQ